MYLLLVLCFLFLVFAFIGLLLSRLACCRTLLTITPCVLLAFAPCYCHTLLVLTTCCCRTLLSSHLACSRAFLLSCLVYFHILLLSCLAYFCALMLLRPACSHVLLPSHLVVIVPCCSCFRALICFHALFALAPCLFSRLTCFRALLLFISCALLLFSVHTLLLSFLCLAVVALPSSLVVYHFQMPPAPILPVVVLLPYCLVSCVAALFGQLLRHFLVQVAELGAIATSFIQQQRFFLFPLNF